MEKGQGWSVGSAAASYRGYSNSAAISGTDPKNAGRMAQVLKDGGTSPRYDRRAFREDR
jgi:hypothetical protein